MKQRIKRTRNRACRGRQCCKKPCTVRLFHKPKLKMRRARGKHPCITAHFSHRKTAAWRRIKRRRVLSLPTNRVRLIALGQVTRALRRVGATHPRSNQAKPQVRRKRKQKRQNASRFGVSYLSLSLRACALASCAAQRSLCLW